MTVKGVEVAGLSANLLGQSGRGTGMGQVGRDDMRGCPGTGQILRQTVKRLLAAAHQGTPVREPIEELLVQRRSRLAIRPVPRILAAPPHTLSRRCTPPWRSRSERVRLARSRIPCSRRG